MFELEEGARPRTREPRARAPAPGRSGRPVEPSRLWRSVASRWRSWLGLAAVSFVASVVVAKTLVPRTFMSEAILIWEPAVGGGPASDTLRELRTLLDTVKLPGNLEEIRRISGAPVTLPALGKQIEVEPGKESNILSIQARDRDAARAASLATTATRVFLDAQIGTEKARAAERVQAIDVETAQARRELDQARREYDEFRTAHGIVDLGAERQAAIQEAAALRAEVNRSRVRAEAEGVKADLLKSAMNAEPTSVVLSETETLAAGRKLAELRAEYVAKRAALSDAHPIVQGLRDQMNALSERASREATTAERVMGVNQQRTFLASGAASAGAERTSAERQAASFAALEQATRERVNKLSSAEGQASLLLTTLRLVEDRVARLEGERLSAAEALRQPRSGFRILSPAVVPALPEKSHRRAVVFALPVVVLLVAMAMRMGAELARLRPESPAEIAFWGAGPVVASSRWPGDGQALGDLLDDLELGLGMGRGDTLVLPCVAADAELATALVAGWRARAEARGEGARVSAGLVAVDASVSGTSGLRRRARACERVLVLVRSGACRPLDVGQLRQRLGGEVPLAYVVVGARPEIADTVDRVGDVPAFWRGTARDLDGAAA